MCSFQPQINFTSQHSLVFSHRGDEEKVNLFDFHENVENNSSWSIKFFYHEIVKSKKEFSFVFRFPSVSRHSLPFSICMPLSTEPPLYFEEHRKKKFIFVFLFHIWKSAHKFWRVEGRKSIYRLCSSIGKSDFNLTFSVVSFSSSSSHPPFAS